MKTNPSKHIPVKTSTDEEWINWHKAMRSRYGKKDANAAFVKVFGLRGSASANTGNLRDYLKDEGIDIAANSILGEMRDDAVGAIDTIGSVFKFGGYVTLGLIAIPVILISVVVWQSVKNPEIIKAVRG